MSYQDIIDATWTKWPKRSEISLYDRDGVCIERRRSKNFDLSDLAGSYFDGGSLEILFGIRCRGKTGDIWSEERLRAQESNIRYDLTFDAFQVWMERLKGPGLSCQEEVLWRLHINSA